jgi:hypothetical protein
VQILNEVEVGDYIYCYGRNKLIEGEVYDFEYICKVINITEEPIDVLVLDIWAAGGEDYLDGYWNLDQDTLAFYESFIKI